jgi:membrane protein YdbS with pleckstrin-like domain
MMSYLSSKFGTGGSVLIVWTFILTPLMYFIGSGFQVKGFYLFWMDLGSMIVSLMVLVVVCWVIHLLYKGFVSIRNKLRRQR